MWVQILIVSIPIHAIIDTIYTHPYYSGVLISVPTHCQVFYPLKRDGRSFKKEGLPVLQLVIIVKGVDLEVCPSVSFVRVIHCSLELSAVI